MEFKNIKALNSKDMDNNFSTLLPDFKCTSEIEDLNEMIGQKRAVKAVEFGLNMQHPGYNIFVSGLPGTGKITYIKNAVNLRAQSMEIPSDWIYVHNFNWPDQPVAIALAPGQGKVFARDMEELLDEIQIEVHKSFSTDKYDKLQNELFKEIKDEQQKMMSVLDKDAKEKGFLIQKKGAGLLTLPAVEGRPMTQEEFEQLNDEEKKHLSDISQLIQDDIVKAVRQSELLERDVREKLRELDNRIALDTVEGPLNALIEKYTGNDKLVLYLKAVRDNIVDNINDFREQEEKIQFSFVAKEEGNPFLKYKINLFIDNSELTCAPVIVENNPTYINLTGKLEYINRMGTMLTNFMQIKPGSLHKANGGFLIINIRDIFAHQLAWEALKKALKNRKIIIENVNEYLGVLTISTLKPEAIPFSVKIILLGNPRVFSILYEYDEDFLELFKVKADFDIEMTADQENLARFVNFIATQCRSNNILHFNRDAVLAVAHFSSQLAGHKAKLSTKFNEIVEILFEADCLARTNKKEFVESHHVFEAINNRIHRSNRYEEKIHEMVENNSLLIDLEGNKIGQVNGLTVLDLGDYRFGHPVKITAATYAGQKGIINIEREVKMSGQIHSKGILILSGYLGEKYARNEPLSLSASITFEQTYSNIDGDSASAAELIAIISSLADIPIKQNMAITGSVNQKGEIQPVGGIIEKIEGFYKTCQAKGISAPFDVIIPTQNKDNVILSPEVKGAVERKELNIFPVKNIGEAILLLTGYSLGERDSNNEYPEGTINYLVEKRLKELSEALRKNNKVDK